MFWGIIRDFVELQFAGIYIIYW